MTPDLGRRRRLSGGDADALRAILRRSQEFLLEDTWDTFSPTLRRARTALDVGCGLGGTALFLASRGLAVTALTNVPEHGAIVRELARACELGERVTVDVADAHEWSRPAHFDVAVAIESACYLNPATWFASLSRSFRPRGRLILVDVFVTRPEVAQPFDRYWSTRIVSFDSHAASAKAQGFRLASTELLSERAAEFWDASVGYSRLALRSTATRATRRRIERSIAEHERLARWLRTGGLEFRRSLFELTEPPRN
jgi:cyclopropane fatty-acyl-phospholipid synthase-like methyltransferase